MIKDKASALALIAFALPLAAQVAPAIPTTNPKVRAALDLIKADNAWTMQQEIELTQIPSPPFKESTRAAEYKRRLEALGLRDVHIDSVGNVIAERRGVGAGPTVVIAGHLDTVFPEGTDVTVKHDGGRLRAPGIGDDDRGLAVVLAVARAFEKTGLQTNGTVYFVGDVGEEGPGNLRGMRYLFGKELKGKVDYFISVDDAGLGIASRAVGSYRYRVSYKGPGGHSYGAFGIPNPIHALGRAIAGIADVQVPVTPKTTFNVGVIQGGTSVNSIAGEASMEVDMRSEDAKSLAAVDAQVQRILRDALSAENSRWKGSRAASAQLTLHIDTIGIRPTGAQADTAPIIQTALAAAKALGFTSATSASSTDANIPISLGIPAMRIGGGGGAEGAHSLGEWYEDGPNGYLGPQWALLIVAALAGARQ
ncbi:MAG TPA: M20/M25/M40 family metallo-hydrolase [Gemmatimonadaceae bacterium]|nr:M20/M25/M40 family metallo-hydrolase [Gemmatimonadaceae bacterium]